MMKFEEQVVRISEENRSRFFHLYGEMNEDDLSRIVNHHLEVAMDEIEEDGAKQRENKNDFHCSECEFMKMYDYGSKNYYCDHEDRIDDMGKLGVDDPPKARPVWCPLRQGKQVVGLLLHGGKFRSENFMV